RPAAHRHSAVCDLYVLRSSSRASPARSPGVSCPGSSCCVRAIFPFRGQEFIRLLGRRSISALSALLQETSSGGYESNVQRGEGSCNQSRHLSATPAVSPSSAP